MPKPLEAAVTAKPYSPETLGARWDCSAEKIRLMCHSGELASFRLGKLIRIPGSEVERYECQTSTPLPSTEESGASHIVIEESRAGLRLARQIGGGPKLSPVNYGHE